MVLEICQAHFNEWKVQVQNMDTEKEEVLILHQVLNKNLFVKINTKSLKIESLHFIGGDNLGNFKIEPNV